MRSSSAGHGVERAHRARRQRRRRIARRRDARITRQPGFLVQAEVARRDHDDQSLTDRVLDCLHERVGRRRLVNRMAERQVQDVDAEEILVRDRELDRADDVGRRALALSVEHAQANQPRVGRHADKLAGDQPGDVRAMTVRIDRRDCANVALSEVVERRDAIVEVGTRLDAGVDDRDADTVAAGCIRGSLERVVVDGFVVELLVGGQMASARTGIVAKNFFFSPRAALPSRSRAATAVAASTAPACASTSAFCAFSAVA